MIVDPPNSLADVLARHVVVYPERLAYRFLDRGDLAGPIRTLSFGELEQRASQIGELLRREQAAGARVLLLYPAGLDFVCGFLGCTYAGAVAVPAYPPDAARLDRTLPRLARIVADCGARVVLTTRAIVAMAASIAAAAPELAGLTWLATDELPAPAPRPVSRPEVAANDVAFLQYTSGSTGTPKGVMVTHANLMHNLRVLQATYEQNDRSELVSWLPAYHDMGLVAGILYPLFLGATGTLFSPLAFVQKPLRWLQALSHFRASFSIAPNFAYDLCVRKVSDTELDTLNLSSWAVAGNGAEPIRKETLDRFSQRFAPAGFRRAAFLPCYGLAEATLLVTGARKVELPRIETRDGRAHVSCGRPRLDVDVAIVDPETRTRRASGEIGEIWVKSPSNARGYWQRPEETLETFRACLGDGDGPFLRTGDLGFQSDGELYVSGRVKDLIIIGGVNHYPQDLEHSVQDCDPAIRGGCVAAFSVDAGDEERLVVTAEIDDAAAARAGAIVAAIRRAIAEQHELEVHAVTLLAARTIPKTSSGKIRRREARARFLAGTLATMHAWSATAIGRSAAEFEAWLVAQLALRVAIDPRRIDTDTPFASYGLVSRDAVGLSGELARWLGRPVPPTVVYEYPTIGALVRHLSEAPAPVTIEAAGADAGEPVAIIGIGCRFPGADGALGYWSLLAQGKDAISDVPADRWDVEAYHQAGSTMPGKMYTRRGGFLDGVGDFDAGFFGLSPAEAAHMDPQQRLLLEMAWAALEDAGLLPEQLAGSATGVFVGITTSDYAQLQLLRGLASGPYAATGNVFCMAANRLSYTFDFRGPSLALDTACSSSLVAIHHACASLRRGESTLALAGGVNLMLSPQTTVALCQTGALSPDGRCHSFDARANGYVRGEGAGLVVLKPLARALADGDRVYAVIRGSAVNQDGRSNGLTAPNPEAHARVMRQALADARLAPARLQYVETHGTGTALGDPIEARALGAVLAGELGPDQRLRIGSVKSNFGHLEPAAGVAGLSKVALAMHHDALPPSLHFERGNPHIAFDELKLEVQTELGPWPAGRGSKVAGVSSFGVGGTNAHVVLEEAPAQPHAGGGDDDGRPQLLVLSARSPAALATLAGRFAGFLPGTSAELAAIGHTAALRRTHHEHRLALVAGSAAELAERLARVAAGEPAPDVSFGQAVKGRRPRLVFVFPGQGPQYLGMGRRLYQREPAFRAAFERCERAMQPYLDWSLRAQLFADEASSQLDRDEVVQPMLFVIQVCLAATWRARGVEPDAVVGHSMGEVAAAYVAGALDLDDAARVTCLRANHLASLRGQGAMAVVGLSRQATLAELAAYPERLHLAASNGPSLSVVSGDADALAELTRALAGRDVFCRPIKARGAGHSPVVEPVARALAGELSGLRPRPTRVPMYSSVSAAPVAGEALDAGYWARNLREPVLFCPAVERLLADGHELFLELSPSATLVLPIQETIAAAGQRGQAIASLARQLDDEVALLEAFGALHVHGHPVDFRRLHPVVQPVVSLPSGPWQRERCWFEDGPAAAGPLVGPRPAAAPASLEDAVRAAFASVLRVQPVGADDSFFELGGTSLMAAQMLYALRSSLARDIPLRLLFDHPSIAGLTRALEERAAAAGAPVATAAAAALVRVEAAHYPLSINQERMLLAQRRAPRHDSAHVLAQHLRLDGRLDRAALERALDRMVELHDGLRTVFTVVDGEQRQRLAAYAPAPLALTDLGAASGAAQERALLACLREHERPFELFDAPMYRFALTRLGDERHVLSIVLHHLVTDGWSQGVLFQDLARTYEAYRHGQPDGLAAPPLRLVDYAHWERQTYAGEHLEACMDYWRGKLRRLRAPQLPFVRRRAPGAGGPPEARLAEVELDEALVARLEEVARATTTTMQMVVLAGFLLALRRASGQDEITVPTSASNRERPDLQQVMGFLSQPRLVTADFAGQPSLGECLVRVRDAVLAAGEEQGLSMSQYYHLEDLDVDDIPFRVSMNYLPQVDLPTAFGEAAIGMLPRQSSYALFRDFLLIVRAGRGRIHLTFGYAAGVVDDAEMKRFAHAMKAILSALADDHTQLLEAALEPSLREDAA